MYVDYMGTYLVSLVFLARESKSTSTPERTQDDHSTRELTACSLVFPPFSPLHSNVLQGSYLNSLKKWI
jgi:hypothetical protein